MISTEFLSRMSDSLDEWSAYSRFTLKQKKFAPPSGQAVNTFKARFPDLLPDDIAEFYRTVASRCAVEYLMDFTGCVEGYDSRDVIAVPEYLLGEFKLDSMTTIAENMGKLAELTVTDVYTAKFERSQMNRVQIVIQHAVPLFVTQGSGFFVWIAENGVIPSGLYMILLECFYEIEKYVRYADSFSEWLRFSELSLYLSPDLCEMERFHSKGPVDLWEKPNSIGDRLVPNPKFTEKVLGLFATESPKNDTDNSSE